MRQVTLLHPSADEDVFYNAVGILVQNVVRKCVGDPTTAGFLTALWTELRQWSWAVPGETSRVAGMLKPLVEKKSGEFWVWELVADAAETDDERLSAYSKAMLCRPPEKMTVALREKVGMFLWEKGYKAEAKRELEEVVRIRTENKWRIPEAVLSRLGSDELRAVAVATDNRGFYRSRATAAEDRMLGRAERMTVWVSHVNEEKGFVSFKTKEGRSGFFREKNAQRRGSLQKGDTIEIEVLKLEAKKPSRVRSWRKAPKG